MSMRNEFAGHAETHLPSAREGRGFEQAERDFEAWWQTLHIEPAPGAPPTPAAEAEPAPPGGAP